MAESNFPLDPMLLVTLREQMTELLRLSQSSGLMETDGGRPGPGPGATTPPRPADLKRLIQLRARRRREPTGSFLEWPAWDMLLDLAAVGAEGGHISVSAICVSSGAPQSTALRKLAQLENAGLVRRYLHDTDRRRVCLALTNSAFELVNQRIAEDLQFYTELSEAFAKRNAEVANPSLHAGDQDPRSPITPPSVRADTALRRCALSE